MNCGRCGRPIFEEGQPVCSSCRRTISKDATRHAARMNRKVEEQDEMFMNLASPGEQEDVKEDMKHQHYVDTHDASAVWADVGDMKGGSRRRKP